MATVEQVKAEVLELFKEQTGMTGKTAWPVGRNVWQVEGQDGKVYIVRW